MTHFIRYPGLEQRRQVSQNQTVLPGPLADLRVVVDEGDAIAATPDGSDHQVSQRRAVTHHDLHSPSVSLMVPIFAQATSLVESSNLTMLVPPVYPNNVCVPHQTRRFNMTDAFI
jgi:hypothetical protein